MLYIPPSTVHPLCLTCQVPWGLGGRWRQMPMYGKTLGAGPERGGLVALPQRPAGSKRFQKRWLFTACCSPAPATMTSLIQPIAFLARLPLASVQPKQLGCRGWLSKRPSSHFPTKLLLYPNEAPRIRSPWSSSIPYDPASHVVHAAPSCFHISVGNWSFMIK